MLPAVPVILPVFVPLLVAFYWVRTRYVATSREVKRLEAITRSPVYAQLSAVLTVSTCWALQRASAANMWSLSGPHCPSQATTTTTTLTPRHARYRHIAPRPGEAPGLLLTRLPAGPAHLHQAYAQTLHPKRRPSAGPAHHTCLRCGIPLQAELSGISDVQRVLVVCLHRCAPMAAGGTWLRPGLCTVSQRAVHVYMSASSVAQLPLLSSFQ
jgi:hypothetical protein